MSLSPRVQYLISFMHNLRSYTLPSLYVLSDTVEQPLRDTTAFYDTTYRNSEAEITHFQAKVNDWNNRTFVVQFTVLELSDRIVIEVESDDNPDLCIDRTARAPARLMNILRLHVNEFILHYLPKKEL